MKTSDVKCDKEYIYKGDVVKVIKRIKGRETTQRIMQSGQLFTGYKRERKKFLLNNGEVVFADKLEQTK
jgi:hypothetical protein